MVPRVPVMTSGVAMVVTERVVVTGAGGGGVSRHGGGRDEAAQHEGGEDQEAGDGPGGRAQGWAAQGEDLRHGYFPPTPVR